MSRLWVLCVICGLSEVAVAKVSPLPSWSDEDKARLKKGEFVVGQALLTKEGRQGKMPAEPIAAEVVIEAVEEKPSLEIGQNLESDSEINGEHLERYFGAVPSSSLIDPQQLLSMQEKRDLTHALKLHGEDSELPIFVYLFDSEQKLSNEFSPQNIYDSLFNANNEPLVIVYYFLGAPTRSNFLLVGGNAAEVPSWQIRELLKNSAYKAKEKSDHFDQLRDFVGQLSMRLFWVEEMMREMVHEQHVILPVAKVKTADPRTEKILGFWEDSVKNHLPKICLIGGFAVFVLLIGGYWVLRRRYLFPDNPSGARLGADIGGAYGGILSYRNQNVPPSEQKGQFDGGFF